MVKVRKICVGDFVDFGNFEWIVVKKTDTHCNLVRRQAVTTAPIRVSKQELKLADQSWREQLRANDPVSVFMIGTWTPARISRREGRYVYVQPSFTNYVKKIHIHSGELCYTQHDNPLWQEDETRDVMFEGVIRVQRGEGLMYPWQYGETLPVPQLEPKFITHVTFNLNEVESGNFPFSVYQHLTADEIAYDLRENCTYHRQHPVLHDMVYQYVNVREMRFPLWAQNTLQVFLDVALANDDQRRVAELLTAVGSEQLYQTNEWIVQDSVSKPFFDLSFRVEGDKLVVGLYWNKRRYYHGVRDQKLHATVKTILEFISEEQCYSPRIIETDGSPEESYVLSRMLGMEMEPLESLYLRKVNNKAIWLNLDSGFCTPRFEKKGGVVATCGMDYKALVRSLVKRSPLKTLIIVHADVIRRWRGAEFSIWHGSKRNDEKICVVTTPKTFSRSWVQLGGFRRLICVALPSERTVYAEALQYFSCKTRWAFMNLSSSKESFAGAFNVHGIELYEQATITLDREAMEHMGVVFPCISETRHYCEPYEYGHVLENLRGESENKKADYISRYLLHTGLVPKYLTGKKLEQVEATVEKVCDQFKLKQERLQDHLKDRCAVCLETMTEPMVTKCGHVYCKGCANELKERNANCPMCRKKIDGYIKISETNTKGHIVMHRGTCYRVEGNDKWGSKINYVKKHRKKATILTKHASVKKKLKKKFPKTEIITTSAIEHGARVSHKKIISMEPLETSVSEVLTRAWGKDLSVTSLSYRINL